MQTRVGVSWFLIFGAACAFAFAVGSAAIGNVRGFWFAFGVGLMLTFTGLSVRRRADHYELHAGHPAERGLLADESDIALPERPLADRHERDLEDRGRP